MPTINQFYHISIKPKLKQSRQSIISGHQRPQTTPRRPVIRNYLLLWGLFRIRYIWGIFTINVTIVNSISYIKNSSVDGQKHPMGYSDIAIIIHLTTTLPNLATCSVRPTMIFTQKFQSEGIGQCGMSKWDVKFEQGQFELNDCLNDTLKHSLTHILDKVNTCIFLYSASEYGWFSASYTKRHNS